MDYSTIIFVGVPVIIGYATVLFRLLDKLTPLTKSRKDDAIVKQVLKGLLWVAENVSFNKSSKEVIIKTSKK